MNVTGGIPFPMKWELHTYKRITYFKSATSHCNLTTHVHHYISKNGRTLITKKKMHPQKRYYKNKYLSFLEIQGLIQNVHICLKTAKFQNDLQNMIGLRLMGN